MATIEERLKELSMQLIYDGLGDESAYEKHSAAKAAIIADWNAATESMKTLVHDILDLRLDPDYWYCPICRGSVEFHPDRHAPDKCSVAAAQAMIAQMEGYSHSRDEALVEDKRYERDDIYKK